MAFTSAAIFPRATGCVTRARPRQPVTTPTPVCHLRAVRRYTRNGRVLSVIMATRRALHFVFKVGNRFQTTHFYRDVLGMKVQTGPRGADVRGWYRRLSRAWQKQGRNAFVVNLSQNPDIGPWPLAPH